MRARHGKTFTGLVALGAAIGALALPALSIETASAAPTPAEDKHHVVTTVKEAHVALDGWRSGTFTVDCPTDYYAVDGGFLLDAVDDGYLDEVYVLASGPTAHLGGWSATVRNDNDGRAQGKLKVTCLSATTSELDGHAHTIPAPTATPGTAFTWLGNDDDDGDASLSQPCAPGEYAVAPAFAFTSGYGTVRRAEAKGKDYFWEFDAYAPGKVTVRTHCLKTELPASVHGKASTSLVLTSTTGTVTGGDGWTVEETLTCADGGHGLVGSYASEVGLLSLGADPRGTARMFRFVDAVGEHATAQLGLLCVAPQTGATPPPLAYKVNTWSKVNAKGKFVIYVACTAECKVRATVKTATAPRKVVAFGKATLAPSNVNATPEPHWRGIRLSVKPGMKGTANTMSHALLEISINGKTELVNLVVAH